MPVLCKARFRPFLEILEARDVPSANVGVTPSDPAAGSALVSQFQASSGMQIDYQGLVNNVANAAASQRGSVQNGVVDVTQQVKSTLETEITARVPKSFTVPLVGEVSLDRVALNRLTLDKAGNFNGQLSLTFKYQMLGMQQSATINANIRNNQVSLDSDNALVKQFGNLEQRQKEVQPYLTAALNQLRPTLMAQYFGTTASANNS